MKSSRTFAENLRLYADLVVRVGLNLQPEQSLVITASGTAPDLAPFVRLIVESAYAAGAYHVDAILIDDHLDRIRLERASQDSLAFVPAWRMKRALDVIERGGATLSILAPNPNLLAKQDPARVAAMSQATAKANQPYYDALVRSQMNWLGVDVPSPAWAALVFPNLTAEERMGRLWDSLFQILRLDRPDPVSAWRDHVAGLKARGAALSKRHYRALHFTGPGTDLTVGLSSRHHWGGGIEVTPSGIEFTPNLPTEEVFTLPDRNVAEGVVRASKPLSLRGVLVEDFSLTFEDGRVVDVKAGRGEETLRRLIATDEGAARLGEVALVPASSPISRQGLLFYSTLLDENAASHLALGRGLGIGARGGRDMTPADLAAIGGNLSTVHVDFMIGSDEVDVDGILPDGGSEPLMRAGEWVFAV